MLEIPLTTDPEQIFSIIVNGTEYDINVKLNSRLGIWFISLAAGGETLVDGVALLCGTNIIGQLNIALASLYIINFTNGKLDPEKDSLGTDSKLFIAFPEEEDIRQAIDDEFTLALQGIS